MNIKSLGNTKSWRVEELSGAITVSNLVRLSKLLKNTEDQQRQNCSN
jgi:hypothetical protein